ncbi:MAG: hypothetical protein AAGU74_08280 [Bacillota bacterium]
MVLNLGLSVADLHDLTIGMVFDLALYKIKDKDEEREAGQADFDAF